MSYCHCWCSQNGWKEEKKIPQAFFSNVWANFLSSQNVHFKCVWVNLLPWEIPITGALVKHGCKRLITGACAECNNQHEPTCSSMVAIIRPFAHHLSCTFWKTHPLYMTRVTLIKLHRAAGDPPHSLNWTLKPEHSSWEQKQWLDVLVGPIADGFWENGPVGPKKLKYESD